MKSFTIPQPIQAVLFDLDGTLRTSAPTPHEVFYHFARQAGAVINSQQWRSALHWAHAYWANSQDLFEDIETLGKFSEEFWENYSQRYLGAFTCSAEVIAEAAPKLANYFDECYKPLTMVTPDVFETLATLRQAGLRLGVVTNRDRPCDDELGRLGLLDYFDFALAAGQVNTWKPDPAIFKHALELSQSSPENTLYLGDNYFTDVVGAQRAGLQPVLIDPFQVFPEAECPVVQQVGGLLPLVLHEPTA